MVPFKNHFSKKTTPNESIISLECKSFFKLNNSNFAVTFVEQLGYFDVVKILYIHLKTEVSRGKRWGKQTVKSKIILQLI